MASQSHSKVTKGKARRLSRRLRIFLILSGVCLLFVMAFVIYCESYYHAEAEALEVSVNYHTVDVRTLSDNAIAYTSESSSVGLIFYPGEKVEPEAYAPLMCECACRGVTCILVRMPGNMPFLGENYAAGLKDLFPDVTEWYMAGHSGGGSAASRFVKANADAFAGIVFLASCPDADLSGTSLRALTVRGSEDGIVKGSDLAKTASYLPEDSSEVIIDGGCHSYFGLYGMQSGDGTPTVTAHEQISRTADLIAGFVL